MQTMTLHDNIRQKQGFEQPLDESPINTPDGWFGGKVVNTGGSVYCRMWHTVESLSAEEIPPHVNTYYEVLYNLSDRHVDLCKYERSENSNRFQFVEVVDSKSAEFKEDIMLMQRAKALMKENRIYY